MSDSSEIVPHAALSDVLIEEVRRARALIGLLETHERCAQAARHAHRRFYGHAVLMGMLTTAAGLIWLPLAPGAALLLLPRFLSLRAEVLGRAQDAERARRHLEARPADQRADAAAARDAQDRLRSPPAPGTGRISAMRALDQTPDAAPVRIWSDGTGSAHERVQWAAQAAALEAEAQRLLDLHPAQRLLMLDAQEDRLFLFGATQAEKLLRLLATAPRTPATETPP